MSDESDVKPRPCENCGNLPAFHAITCSKLPLRQDIMDSMRQQLIERSRLLENVSENQRLLMEAKAELQAEIERLKAEVERLSIGILENTTYPEPLINGSAVDSAIALIKHRKDVLLQLREARKLIGAMLCYLGDDFLCDQKPECKCIDHEAQRFLGGKVSPRLENELVTETRVCDPKNCSGCYTPKEKCLGYAKEQKKCCPDCEHERGCYARVWDGNGGDMTNCGKPAPCPDHDIPRGDVERVIEDQKYHLGRVAQKLTAAEAEIERLKAQVEREHECAEELKEGLSKQYRESATELDALEAKLKSANLQLSVYEEALDGVCIRCFWSGKAEERQGFATWSRSLHGTKKPGFFVCSRCLKPEDGHGGTNPPDDTCLSPSGPYCSQFEANAQIHAPRCQYAETRVHEKLKCGTCGHDDVNLGHCTDAQRLPKFFYQELHCRECCQSKPTWMAAGEPFVEKRNHVEHCEKDPHCRYGWVGRRCHCLCEKCAAAKNADH